jgi:polyisoprenoid-binding protein YceI
MNTHSLSPESSLANTQWRLDASVSTASFQVPHFWGLVTVKGQVTRLDGELELDHGRPRRMTLTIDAGSVHTGNRRRDRHLRSGDFFDTDNHPEVRFRSTSISEVTDDRLGVEGELEAAGQRISLTLEPTIQRVGDTLEIDLTTTIDQRQLGIMWSPLGMTRSPTALTVHATLRRQPT